MREYSAQLKRHMKHFFKCRGLSVILFATYLLVYLGAVYFIGMGMEGFELLCLLCRISFYFSGILCTVSWVYLERSKLQYVDETLQAIDKKKYSYQFYGFLVQCILSVIFFSLLLAVLAVCSGRNDATPYFLSHMASPFLYNIVMPHFILLGLVFVLSKGGSRIWSLCIYIAFMVLASPFAEGLIWQTRPVFPIDQIINAIRWPFAIFYQNGNWSADIQYGLQTERARAAVLLFWLCVLICSNYLVNREKARWKKPIVCGTSLLLAVVLLTYSYLPSSLYRLNYKWDGNLYDMSEYHVFQGKNKLDKALLKSPAYQVTDYVLDLSFNRQMDVEGTIKVEAGQPRSEFLFTLYRGFTVDELKAMNLPCQYKQEGDSLTVTFQKPVSSFSASISYHGFSKKFYSNSQAAMLPGYFPWYPMAGERQIFLESANGYGYNPYNRIDKAHIKLQTDAKFTCITNLKQEEGNQYEGEADSITLFGGNLAVTEHPPFVNYLPFDTGGSKNLKAFLESMGERFHTTLENLNDYGFDTSELVGKKILCPSKDIGRNFLNNNFAVFGDYLIAAQGFLNTGDVMQYYIAREDKWTPLITLFNASGISSHGTLAGLESMENSLNMDMQLEEGGRQEAKNLQENIEKSCTIAGKQEFMRALTQYAATDNGIDNDEEFFGQWVTDDDKN